MPKWSRTVFYSRTFYAWFRSAPFSFDLFSSRWLDDKLNLGTPKSGKIWKCEERKRVDMLGEYLLAFPQNKFELWAWLQVEIRCFNTNREYSGRQFCGDLPPEKSFRLASCLVNLAEVARVSSFTTTLTGASWLRIESYRSGNPLTVHVMRLRAKCLYSELCNVNHQRTE